MSGKVDNHIPEDLFQKQENVRYKMGTIFYKIFIQKHEIIRYVDIVDKLVYKVYIQKKENVR
jgi:hypothetical protein